VPVTAPVVPVPLATSGVGEVVTELTGYWELLIAERELAVVAPPRAIMPGESGRRSTVTAGLVAVTGAVDGATITEVVDVPPICETFAGRTVPEVTPCTETTLADGVPAVPGAEPARVAVSVATVTRGVPVPCAPVPVETAVPATDERSVLSATFVPVWAVPGVRPVRAVTAPFTVTGTELCTPPRMPCNRDEIVQDVPDVAHAASALVPSVVSAPSTSAPATRAPAAMEPAE